MEQNGHHEDEQGDEGQDLTSGAERIENLSPFHGFVNKVVLSYDEDGVEQNQALIDASRFHGVVRWVKQNVRLVCLQPTDASVKVAMRVDGLAKSVVGMDNCTVVGKSIGELDEVIGQIAKVTAKL